jgi:hypothetical protein
VDFPAGKAEPGQGEETPAWPPEHVLLQGVRSRPVETGEIDPQGPAAGPRRPEHIRDWIAGPQRGHQERRSRTYELGELGELGE